MDPANPSDTHNAANALHQDSRTPGLNSFVRAWGALQDFTGAWAVQTYNNTTYLAGAIGDAAR